MLPSRIYLTVSSAGCNKLHASSLLQMSVHCNFPEFPILKNITRIQNIELRSSIYE
jgi:hypothetical protein